MFYKIRQYFDILQNIGSNCYLEGGLGKLFNKAIQMLCKCIKKAKGKNEESKTRCGIVEDSSGCDVVCNVFSDIAKKFCLSFNA